MFWSSLVFNVGDKHAKQMSLNKYAERHTHKLSVNIVKFYILRPPLKLDHLKIRRLWKLNLPGKTRQPLKIEHLGNFTIPET